MVSWEFISWQVDLMRVDLVAIKLMSWYLDTESNGGRYQLLIHMHTTAYHLPPILAGGPWLHEHMLHDYSQVHPLSDTNMNLFPPWIYTPLLGGCQDYKVWRAQHLGVKMHYLYVWRVQCLKGNKHVSLVHLAHARTWLTLAN